MYYSCHDGSRDFPAKFFSWKWSLFIFREIPGKFGSYSMFFLTFPDKHMNWIDICVSPIPSFSFHSTEILAALNISKGSFNNYVDKFLPFSAPTPLRGPFFTLSVDKDRHFLPPPPPRVDIFYTLSVDKNIHFLPPSALPSHLVHVVIECPLIQIAVLA